MTVAYATAADLEAFLSPDIDAPGDVDRLLERASELLDDHILAGFAVDTDTNLPTDTDVATALTGACCAQVEAWLAGTGETLDIEGLGGTKVSAGGASYQLPYELAPRARRLLAAAGLLTLSPPVSTVLSGAGRAYADHETTWGAI